jgi:hypothetical protein
MFLGHCKFFTYTFIWRKSICNWAKRQEKRVKQFLFITTLIIDKRSSDFSELRCTYRANLIKRSKLQTYQLWIFYFKKESSSDCFFLNEFKYNIVFLTVMTDYKFNFKKPKNKHIVNALNYKPIQIVIITIFIILKINF